jgi:hypothetical protein
MSRHSTINVDYVVLVPTPLLNMDVQRLVDESLRKTIILPRAPGILLYILLSSQFFSILNKTNIRLLV